MLTLFESSRQNQNYRIYFDTQFLWPVWFKLTFHVWNTVWCQRIYYVPWSLIFTQPYQTPVILEFFCRSQCVKTHFFKDRENKFSYTFKLRPFAMTLIHRSDGHSGHTLGVYLNGSTRISWPSFMAFLLTNFGQKPKQGCCTSPYVHLLSERGFCHGSKVHCREYCLSLTKKMNNNRSA